MKSFLWPSIAVHSESKWVCKGDSWLENWREYWDINFICVGTQDRILIDINHDYQIMMNQYYCISCLSFKIFLLHIFLDKESLFRKSLPTGGLWLFFISPSRWVGHKLLLKIGLTCIIPWSTMKPENMKSLSEAKLRYSFQKNVKLNSSHYFTILSTILFFTW